MQPRPGHMMQHVSCALICSMDFQCRCFGPVLSLCKCSVQLDVSGMTITSSVPDTGMPKHFRGRIRRSHTPGQHAPAASVTIPVVITSLGSCASVEVLLPRNSNETVILHYAVYAEMSLTCTFSHPFLDHSSSSIIDRGNHLTIVTRHKMALAHGPDHIGIDKQNNEMVFSDISKLLQSRIS